jgi:hypothetical protein
MIEAFWTDADTPPLDYYWAPTSGVSGAQGSLEHGPIKVTDGANPRLASGPKGLFLFSEDGRSTSNLLRLNVRKWSPSTHTFGAPAFVGSVTNDISAMSPGGFGEDATTGALYAAWPGYDANSDYVMRLWTSANGGKAFSRPVTVANVGPEYLGPVYLATTGGRGFATFKDNGGLQLVDLANLSVAAPMVAGQATTSPLAATVAAGSPTT